MSKEFIVRELLNKADPITVTKKSPQGILLEPTMECVEKVKQALGYDEVEFYKDKGMEFMSLQLNGDMHSTPESFRIGTYLIDDRFVVTKNLFLYLQRICKAEHLILFSCKEKQVFSTCVVGYVLGRDLDSHSFLRVGMPTTTLANRNRRTRPDTKVLNLCFDSELECVANAIDKERDIFLLFDDVDKSLVLVENLGLGDYIPALEKLYE